MKYSKLFGKTQKTIATDITLASHKLLVKGGFIKESVAGRYYFLPLGMLVLNKIMNIIREEMNAAGAQETLAPILHPLELWKETNRTNTAGFELMKVKDRRGAEFALGGTAEEMYVDLVRKFNLSYKDLPFNIYQFSNKFRDEMRARGGLLRVREFIMKDAYSFDANEEEFKKVYQKMWNIYTKIFDRMGLKTTAVLSDNGYIGGEYCHEFVVDTDAGESKYLVTEDGSYIAHEDVALFKREEIDMADDVKDFEIVDQPEWVRTMDEFEKYYNAPKGKFLKNVVYKNRVNGEIVIATIRGDLEVNKTKLEHVLDIVGQLEDATGEDLAKLGTKTGYVHSWGYKNVKTVGDISLKSVRNFIGGQKEEKTDSINVNYGRDFECDILADIALAKAGYKTEEGKTLIERKGIEVANIFQLGYHYSHKMAGAVYTDTDGKEKPLYMGCYGIGTGRTLATIVEIYNDEKGIIWPENVAPFKVHLISLHKSGDEVYKKADEIYKKLMDNNIEVIWDDRDVRAGEKFADADLIGIPYRVVVSDKSLEQGGIELKKRNESESKIITISKLHSFI